MKLTFREWYQGKSPARQQRKAAHAAQPVGHTIRGHEPPLHARAAKRIARILKRKQVTA